MTLVLHTVPGSIMHCWVVLTAYYLLILLRLAENAESSGPQIPWLKKNYSQLYYLRPKKKRMFQIFVTWIFLTSRGKNIFRYRMYYGTYIIFTHVCQKIRKVRKKSPLLGVVPLFCTRMQTSTCIGFMLRINHPIFQPCSGPCRVRSRCGPWVGVAHEWGRPNMSPL
jgi:hypothetical protein